MQKELKIINFSKEKTKSLFIGFLIILIATSFLFYMNNHFLFSLLISSFVGGVYFMRSYQWNKYYIQFLSISNGKLTLDYYKNGQFSSVKIDLEK